MLAFNSAKSGSDSRNENEVMTLFHPSTNSPQSARPNVKDKGGQVQAAAQSPRPKTEVTRKRKLGLAIYNVDTSTEDESTECTRTEYESTGYEITEDESTDDGSSSSTIEVVHTTAPRWSRRVAQARARAAQKSGDGRRGRAAKRRRVNEDGDHHNAGDTVVIPREEFGDISQDDSTTQTRFLFLTRLIDHLQNPAFPEPFREPVDCVSLPTFVEEIKEPMGLAKMSRKLGGHQYITVSAFIDDFELMINDFITFNGTGSWVTDYARILERHFITFMRRLPWSQQVSLPRPQMWKIQ